MCVFLVSAKDMKHAGNILIASLGRQPENTLLHWAGGACGFGWFWHKPPPILSQVKRICQKRCARLNSCLEKHLYVPGAFALNPWNML